MLLQQGPALLQGLNMSPVSSIPKSHGDREADRENRLSQVATAAKLELEALRKERDVLKASLTQLSDQV
jgi:hypothetical protein